MRSFERRLARLDEAIELVRSGRGDELERRQRRIRETRAADEASERHEEFEEAALGGVVAVTLMDLQGERSAPWSRGCSAERGGSPRPVRTPNSRSSAPCCAIQPSPAKSSSSRAHEEAAGATVHEVSRPDLARRAGLTDWPGFDLRSLRPASTHGPREERAIEVKGRAGSGAIEVLENEWAKACNLRDRYWLYVVFDCAAPQPRLIKVRDPFGRLLAKAKGSMLIAATEIFAPAYMEGP